MLSKAFQVYLARTWLVDFKSLSKDPQMFAVELKAKRAAVKTLWHSLDEESTVCGWPLISGTVEAGCGFNKLACRLGCSQLLACGNDDLTQ